MTRPEAAYQLVELAQRLSGGEPSDTAKVLALAVLFFASLQKHPRAALGELVQLIEKMGDRMPTCFPPPLPSELS